MNKLQIAGTSLVTALALLVSGCGAQKDSTTAQVNSQPTTPTLAQKSAASCPAAETGASFLCGPLNAEDILRIGKTDWLLTSGMAGMPDVNGRLHLINSKDRSWEVLFPDAATKFEHDKAMFPDCPGPLDTAKLSLHGIALQNFPVGSSKYRLYMTSHGSREAIETFMLDASGAKPALTWTGCVPLPADVWANSVVITADGGFMTTKFMDPNNGGFQAIREGKLNGHVLEWHPGAEPRVIAGTELSGPNGIELSADGRYLYVAAFGGNAIVRYDLSVMPPMKTEVAVGVVPDNVRWTDAGTLVTAGGNAATGCTKADGEACGAGWSVYEIDPASLQAHRLTGMARNEAMPTTSTALVIGKEIWAGTPAGDKVAILTTP